MVQVLILKSLKFCLTLTLFADHIHGDGLHQIKKCMKAEKSNKTVRRIKTRRLKQSAV